MTSWMKERDRLVEQTMAFVQGVAAQRTIRIETPQVETPEAEAPLVDAVAPVAAPVAEKLVAVAAAVSPTPAHDASLVEAEALMSLIAMSLPSLRSDPVAPAPQPIVVAETAPPVRAVPKAPVYAPAPRRPNQIVLPEREVIAKRVASFRASQQKQIREREDHYASVQAKIRASLGNDPSAG